MDRKLGTVTWVDLATPDLDKAKKFYGEILGWTFEGGEDAGTGFYTMAKLDGRNVAGMMKLEEQSPMPSMWNVYLATDSVDATTARVKELGGKVIMEPMDVMDQGRMAYFADPTGAHFGVWQAGKHKGAEVVATTGAMCWHETYTRNVEKAKDFYARVFELEARKMDAPGAMDYWTFHKGPNTLFGAMDMVGKMPDGVPPHWNTYFAVADTDKAAEKVVALGGKIMAPPFDTPYGRMTAVFDPFGAAFCLIKPVGPF